MKNWNVILNRKILELFIGDGSLKNNVIYGEYAMPHMSGEEICNFGKKIGCIINYDKEKLSRWQYMERIVNYAIQSNKINDFFKNLISMERFEYLVDEDTYVDSPQEYYWNIVNSLFIRINDYLQFRKLYIEYDLNNYRFNIMSFDDEVNHSNNESADYKEIIKSFCNDIKKNNLKTKYGEITSIEKLESQGANGKILFGKLNGMDVAIKVLYEYGDNKENRFFNEFINVLMALQKVNGVVELYLYDTVKIREKEIQYIVMKRYNNNLSKYKIKDQDTLIKFALELSTIIAKIHKNGIIHRDIKPENIMQDADGNLILTDFGIAYYNPEEFENTGHTVSSEFLCNRRFSAPEQMIKGVTPRVTMDIYSYGQILQYVVTGSPHAGTSKVHIGRFISGNKIEAIDKIIIKCLNYEPDKRFQSMREIIKELEHLIEFDDKNKIVNITKKNNDIDSNAVYEYICINDVVSTKELSEEFNYDIFNLKRELIKLFKVKRLIKPNSLSDILDDDNCNWTRY